MVSINGKPVLLQRDTASHITLISMRTWQTASVITSDKKAMNVSGRFLRLTGELECDVSFDGSQFKGKYYVTKRLNFNLLGLDQIEKLGLLDLPLNRICNSVQSTWPSPAKSNQPAAKQMSTLQEKLLSVSPQPSRGSGWKRTHAVPFQLNQRLISYNSTQTEKC
ncbi:unnamed protein product [Dibothriocephalus latus]|uniref:Uncharacterized protein n=1 Tax=Dibothriocephalus latus TaxID=60516 RepID=A0A3P7MEN1_DIBLA|nr:unnamed protein product [Dibothriocephalus latus]